MKTIFINITDKDKIECRRLKINSNVNYDELLIPLKMLNKRVFEDNGILNKVKSYFFDRKLISILKYKGKDNIYILSKTLENAEKKSALSSVKKYIQDILNRLEYDYYTYSGSIDENIDNYLIEALKKKHMEKKDARILMIHQNLRNINYYMLENLVGECKTVDIYCVNVKDTKMTQRLENINEKYGSSICIKNKLSKQEIKMNPYDICIYMEKSDFKITNALKIFMWDNDSDKFDKYVLLANRHKLVSNVNNDYFSYMTKNYGRLKVISLLCKTILDKNLKII